MVIELFIIKHLLQVNILFNGPKMIVFGGGKTGYTCTYTFKVKNKTKFMCPVLIL